MQRLWWFFHCKGGCVTESGINRSQPSYQMTWHRWHRSWVMNEGLSVDYRWKVERFAGEYWLLFGNYISYDTVVSKNNRDLSNQIAKFKNIRLFVSNWHILEKDSCAATWAIWSDNIATHYPWAPDPQWWPLSYKATKPTGWPFGMAAVTGWSFISWYHFLCNWYSSTTQSIHEQNIYR